MQPTDENRFLVRRFGWALGGTAALGFAIRVANVAWWASKSPPGGDAAYYYFQAKRLVAGLGFVNPYFTALSGHPVAGADHPPAFTVFLAIVQRLGFQSADANRYAVCLLGTATVVLVGLTLRESIGARAGVIGALFAACYPNFWMQDGSLLSEPLYAFAWAFSLFFMFRFLRQEGVWVPLLATAAGLAVCAATRSEALLLIPALLVPLCLSRRDRAWRARLGYLAAALSVPALVLGSWTVYNLGRFEHPVVLSTQVGSTLASTNCRTTFYGPYLGSTSTACDRLPYVEGMDATVHGNASRRQALDYIAGHKSRLPLVVLAREARLWEVWYVDQQVSYDANVMGYGPIRLVRGTLFAYWALALGAVIGAVLWRRRGLRLYPFVVQAAVTALAAAATTGLTRFRIATDVSIVLLAAVALDAAIGAATRAHRSTGATTPDVD